MVINLLGLCLSSFDYCGLYDVSSVTVYGGEDNGRWQEERCAQPVNEQPSVWQSWVWTPWSLKLSFETLSLRLDLRVKAGSDSKSHQ